MRLTALEPRWAVLESGGPRVALSFDCPHCREQRLLVCFHHQGHEAVEDAYILAHHGADDTQHIWNLPSEDNFATLTLTPSIDASKAGHWHGFITNGEVT